MKKKESFLHLCTVLMIMYGDIRDIQNIDTGSKEEYYKKCDQMDKKFKEANKYLKSWIKDNNA